MVTRSDSGGARPVRKIVKPPEKGRTLSRFFTLQPSFAGSTQHMTGQEVGRELIRRACPFSRAPVVANHHEIRDLTFAGLNVPRVVPAGVGGHGTVAR